MKKKRLLKHIKRGGGVLIAGAQHPLQRAAARPSAYLIDVRKIGINGEVLRKYLDRDKIWRNLYVFKDTGPGSSPFIPCLLGINGEEGPAFSSFIFFLKKIKEEKGPPLFFFFKKKMKKKRDPPFSFSFKNKKKSQRKGPSFFIFIFFF
uniref:Uncharacterized protein n=1 Tax=Morchella importuna TaxID=1174673 RepID=A0A650AFP3_9PEZI|nr:hypothetical protein [Morchella importuna]QGN66721.1 hypothetical protein [Morchella importuna]